MSAALLLLNKYSKDWMEAKEEFFLLLTWNKEQIGIFDLLLSSYICSKQFKVSEHARANIAPFWVK